MSPSDRERAQVALDHLRAAEVEVERARQALAWIDGAAVDVYERLGVLVGQVREEQRAAQELLACAT